MAQIDLMMSILLPKLYGTAYQPVNGMQIFLLTTSSDDLMGHITRSRCSCQGDTIYLLYNIRFQCVFSECKYLTITR